MIAAFLDEKGEHVKYSLNKIVEYARRKLGKQPGSWFYITEISWVLSHLHNNDPLNGTQYLRLAFFGETVIYLDELYEALGLDICRCLEPRIKCLKCSSASKYQNHFKDTTSAFKKHPNVTFTTSSKSRQLERHLLIIVSTRLSEE